MAHSRNAVFIRIVVVTLLALAAGATEVVLAGNDTYTYDALGRLLTVTYADGSSITYTYDAVGNRTALSQSAAP